MTNKQAARIHSVGRCQCGQIHDEFDKINQARSISQWLDAGYRAYTDLDRMDVFFESADDLMVGHQNIA
jgi:hypothetical protein